MNIKTPIILTTALMFCAPVFAQTEATQTTKPIAPYGENPNLLHVFAYKAQEGVINTAEKVGEVTEKALPKSNRYRPCLGQYQVCGIRYHPESR